MIDQESIHSSIMTIAIVIKLDDNYDALFDDDEATL